MKYTEALQKRAVLEGAKQWFVDKYNQVADKTNKHIQSRYVEPQARAASDAAFDHMKNNLINYGIPALAGAGVAGIGAYSVAEWINERRKKQKATDSEVLPSKLLASLAAAGGAIGGVMLYDRYGKKASYGDIPVVPDPALEVSPEEQEALEDPSNSKKKKKEKTPDKIQQMIYAQNAKKRHEQMKSASLTYSKVAEFFAKGRPTPEQEWDVGRMSFANPGVSFMWDDEKRQYVPTTYDQTQKTNVPYTGKINQPAPLTEDQQWDRKMYIRSKQMPMTSTTTGSTTTTQGNGTFRFGQYTQDTNFTTPKPVQPVQPPQYRQADTTVKDVEGFR